MTDIPEPSPQRASARIDAPRAAFWAALAAAAGAAGVALTAGPSVGLVGAALLVALAGVALVFLVWLSRGAGRLVGLFPARGAAEAAGLELTRGEFVALEALEEPALVAERAGGAVAANAAYLGLAETAGALGESRRPPMPDRLFGGDPGMSAPMFRLARAARAGQRRREELATALGAGGEARRIEASVAPWGPNRTLWRLAPAAVSAPARGEPRPAFIEESPLGFLAARPDGGVVYVNPALRALLGLTEDVADLNVADLMREDPARVFRRDRRGFGLQRAMVTLCGADRDVRTAALTFWPAGEREGPRLLTLPDTEADGGGGRERSPGAAASGAPLGAAFDHAPFGAALLDGGDPAAATVLDSNSALMAMTQGAATPGASFADLFEASEGVADLADRLRRGAAGHPADLKLATTPPTSAHLHWVRLADGRGLAYLLDVGEQRQLEQRLAQSEKVREIGLLAGGVAHDFNNLLHVMVQRTHTLRLRHPVGDPDYHDLSIIHDHIMRAKELSEMLRAYARQQTFKIEITDVAGFVQKMHELARRMCGDGIRCEVRHEPNLPLVKIDKSQLERVLVNLISNARDAMTPRDSGIPKHGALGLRTGRCDGAAVREFANASVVEDGEYVYIEVSDTGVGIKPEDQHKIFHPFHSTKDPTKGTGLGLATSYGIVKQSGGYIFFQSKPGKGTQFRVFLPVYTPSAEEIEDMQRREREAAQRPALDMAGRGRILFVEDDDIVRESTANNLKQFGYEIIEASDGEEALDLLRADAAGFDLVISDVSMPVMTGTDMVRAAGPELLGRARVLFMTAFTAENVLPEGFEVSYISKPVEPVELARRVKELLAS